MDSRYMFSSQPDLNKEWGGGRVVEFLDLNPRHATPGYQFLALGKYLTLVSYSFARWLEMIKTAGCGIK